MSSTPGPDGDHLSSLPAEDVAWLLAHGWKPRPPVRPRRTARLAARLAAMTAVAVLAFVSGLAMPRAYSVRVGSPPSTERACPPFPSFPDASCTGVPPGVTLTDCPTTVTTNNAVLDSCRFVGGLLIQGTNVTITRSKVEGFVSADSVLNFDLSGLELIDVEIDGTGYVTANGEAAIGYKNYSCLRCNVHGSGRGFNFGTGVTITDSWSHDFTYVEGAHQSAAGSNGGSGNRVIHNRLDCESAISVGCSGSLVMYGDFDPVDDNIIQYNLFDGGSYCLYGGSAGVASGKAYPHATNVKILDNRFGKKYAPTCGSFGPVAAWETDPTNEWSGNEWADGSGPVNP